MSDLTAHVKRVNVNENVLLSITDSNGESVNWFMYEGTRVFLLGGEVYTDEEMYRMLRFLDSSNNPDKGDTTLNDWHIM
ncbi:MAG: hypothetical protein KAJ03_10240 [Gammaproteobacteria bacterium]|nr:hypothetical protein [Gammaproteobacteria bacterium]